MAELAHFKNFAKLKDTSIEFNDITVLAGKPGTGKSYVMKMMYSIEEALYQKDKNYWSIYQTIFSLIDGFYFYDKAKQLPEGTFLYEMLDKKNYSEILNYLIKFNIKLHNKDRAIKVLENIIQNEKSIEFYLNNLISSIFVNQKQISNDYELSFGDILLKYKNEKLSLKREKVYTIQNEVEVVFVETPLILEFKKFMNHEKGKTPYHIESLLNVLDTDYSFIDEEQDKFIKSFREKSQEIIGGNIESSGDSFIFNRMDDKNYDILNASSGIKSIGLLQYLVTNKALKKGSVLFWEEPEVHLHPEWQKKMIELFLELMNAGIKIVFSTHSPYMCEYLNALSKNRKLTDRVSFNLLQEDNGVVENVILKDSENWDLIQSELLDPLEEIAWEYL
ncbi:ATP-binding protein [bacterium]|nr:ATP-binding protein [bacterium]MBU1957422.1 ATP-binding protein [bacterium]